jgi:hypothetical protein
MNAAEKIQAAIERLEELKADGTNGPWFTWHPQRGGRCNSSVDSATHDPEESETVVEGGRGDVELIVTLHRTIDAQLAILWDNLAIADEMTLGYSPDEPDSLARALALAEAILA